MTGKSNFKIENVIINIPKSKFIEFDSTFRKNFFLSYEFLNETDKDCITWNVSMVYRLNSEESNLLELYRIDL